MKVLLVLDNKTTINVAPWSDSEKEVEDNNTDTDDNNDDNIGKDNDKDGDGDGNGDGDGDYDDDDEDIDDDDKDKSDIRGWAECGSCHQYKSSCEQIKIKIKSVITNFEPKLIRAEKEIIWQT